MAGRLLQTSETQTENIRLKAMIRSSRISRNFTQGAGLDGSKPPPSGPLMRAANI
jgi:hypothetical protein